MALLSGAGAGAVAALLSAVVLLSADWFLLHPSNRNDRKSPNVSATNRVRIVPPYDMSCVALFLSVMFIRKQPDTQSEMLE
jgi:hypothetical protein